jgi:hypothetical protein
MKLWDGSTAMQDDFKPETQKTAFDFNAGAMPPSLAIMELVRHIARISAENDYKVFLKSLENRYSGNLEKGPPQ